MAHIKLHGMITFTFTDEENDGEPGLFLSDSRRRTQSHELKKPNVHDIPLPTHHPVKVDKTASSKERHGHSRLDTGEAVHEQQVSRRKMCNKIGVTVPGQFATERHTMFHKLVSNLITKRHVSAFGMHNISAVAEVQSLLKTLGSCGRPRMTALKLKFTGGLTDAENNNVVRLDPVFFHWVQSLGLMDCSSPKVMHLILSAIPKVNSIRYLSFVYCSFDEETLNLLNGIIEHMKTLKRFEFINNTLTTQGCTGILSIFKALENHRFISEFAISHLPITEKLISFKLRNAAEPAQEEECSSHLFTPALCHIITHNHLHTLAISHTNLGEDTLEVIKNLLSGNSVLEVLQLSHCNVLSNPAFEALLRNVLGNRRLQELNFKETELSIESMLLLSEFLSQNSKLVTLVLSVFNSGAIPPIAKGLKANKTLTHLVLAKASFTEAGIALFSGALSSHQSLQSLSLSSNGLIPPNISQLFNGLRASNSLQHIALNNLGLDDLHMIEFSKVLAANTNIIEVDLQKNMISAAGADQLYKGLIYRTKLMKLLLHDNKVKEYDSEIKLLKSRVLYLKVNWF